MSSMMPWEPFREMVSLRDAMSRLFEESVLRPGVFESESTGVLAPIDVYETKEAIVLNAVVPGLKPEELDVSITGDVLTIKGEYKREEAEGRTYLRQERHYGAFTRQLTLPAEVDTNNVSASFENGVLTLQLPKREPVKPKSVKISTKK